MQQLLDGQVRFLLANVVRMPRPPKAVPRKTDRLDTARLQREYLQRRAAVGASAVGLVAQVRRLGCGIL